MLFLAVDLAIFTRLTGAPLDSHGRPLVDSTKVPVNRVIPGKLGRGWQPSYGVRIPIVKQPNDNKNPISSFSPQAIRLHSRGYSEQATKQVPVFCESIEGVSYKDIWPCVTFKMTGHEPLPIFSPYDDLIADDPDAETIAIENEFEEEIATGPGTRLLMPHPECHSLTYTINVYSKDGIEAGFITAKIFDLFPMVSGLLIERMDGSTQCIDMTQKGAAVLDRVDGNLSSEEKYFHRQLTYTVEGYLDHSANKFGYNHVETELLITKRILELADVAGRDIENVQDFNKIEIGEIPEE